MILINKVERVHSQIKEKPCLPGQDQALQSYPDISLSASLLAAFRVVLGKQWLGYYKTSRYGEPTLSTAHADDENWMDW